VGLPVARWASRLKEFRARARAGDAMAGIPGRGQRSVDAVVDAEGPSLPLQLARAAVDAGHGADGFSRVVELLRRSA